MIWAPFALFGLAFLSPLVVRATGRFAGWVLAALPAGLFVLFAGYLPIAPLESVRETVAWMPGLDVEIAFLIDGLSGTFALLVTGIGALVIVYAGDYMKGDDKRTRLFAYLLFFLGAMLGLVLSDNLVSLFVFWELTSVSSYLMIGIYHDREDSRSAALMALLVTGAGGLCLLGGFVLLGIIGGDLGLSGASAWSISEFADLPVRDHPLYAAMLVLVLLGCLTKSAQFPFHFWLPNAMAGPTPVSALLHSATMVKAGVYLVARLSPTLGGTALWEWMLVPAGLATMLIGAGRALGQTDIKKILAFSTLSVLGMLMALLGAGKEKAVEAAVVLLVAHALYKATLFMVAGSIDHETGTREVGSLGGLRKLLPFTFAAGLLAALSKAGAPPLFGFVGKEMFYGYKLGVDTFRGLLILAAVLTNVALVATALMVGLRPFVGKLEPTPKKPHEAPPGMLVGPLLLAAAGLLVGLYPAFFDDLMGSAMASSILGRPVDLHLALWHGISPDALAVMGLSAVTLLAGIWLFRRTKDRLSPVGSFCHRASAYGPELWYRHGLAGLYAGAGRVTRAIQTGYLRHYVLVVVTVAVLAAVPPLARNLLDHAPVLEDSLRFHEVVIALVAMAGAILTIRIRSRLAAVAAVGVTGAAVALLFLLFAAPDLAITQIMVETLSVILFVLLFRGLPRSDARPKGAARAANLVVAIAAGAMMTLLVLAAATVSTPADAARYFAAASQPAAHGRNVVNVILVDFRAVDTLGEISVVAAAAFGVLAMMRLVPGRKKKGVDE
ncbi:MAG: hydrogen gas-evolving membrane-bound hydrogenase subunit E [Planctomycetota bacterium]